MAGLPGWRGALQNAFHLLLQCNVSGALRPKTGLWRQWEWCRGRRRGALRAATK